MVPQNKNHFCDNVMYRLFIEVKNKPSLSSRQPKLAFFLGALIVISLTCLNAYSGQTYTLSESGVIKALVDDNCTASTCQWTELDRNPRTVDFVADESGLFQLHDNGAIWRFTGRPCDQDWCRGWEQLDNNPRTAQIVVADGILYQRHNNGRIYRFTGRPCHGSSCPGWQLLDRNGATADIVAGGSDLFQRHSNGRIYQFTGTPCNATGCPGWRLLDRNPSTINLVATDSKLYQRHVNGRIYEYTNRPCDSTGCRGWRLLDNNSNTVEIVADRNHLYQRHSGGHIFKYTGTPCSGRSCPGWQMLDRNGYTDSISSADGSLIQTHRNGNVWQYTGTPCSGSVCSGWKRIAFVSNLKKAATFLGDALLSEDIIDENLARKTGYKMRPLSGNRPLLLIVADVQRPDGTRLFTLSPTSTYTQLVFGGHPSGLSVTEFFKLSSSNAFRFSNGGTVRVSLRGSNIGSSQFIAAAANAGVDFSIFDRNNDGNITATELSILVIDNITRGLGATRAVDRNVSGVRVLLDVGLAGGQSIFSNFTHEVAHGLWRPTLADLYGSACNLQNVSLLGHCTARVSPTVFDTDSVDLSPWNKSRLGWVMPTVQYSTLKGSCSSVIASSYQYAKENVVLLYDPARSDKEYFMFEHRNNVQQAGFHPYDQDFINKGIVPYYINWTSDPETNIFTNPGGSQDRLMLMSTDPGNNRRENTLNATPTPLKYFNGDETGVRVRGAYKSPLDEAISFFEWDRGVPLRPRVQPAENAGVGIATYSTYRGGRVTLRGQFGLSSQNRRVYLVNGTNRIRIYPYRWSCDQVALNIPYYITTGQTYDLVMTHNDWDSEHTVDAKIRIY